MSKANGTGTATRRAKYEVEKPDPKDVPIMDSMASTVSRDWPFLLCVGFHDSEKGKEKQKAVNDEISKMMGMEEELGEEADVGVKRKKTKDGLPRVPASYVGGLFNKVLDAQRTPHLQKCMDLFYEQILSWKASQLDAVGRSIVAN
ncbi:hypothetical protein RFI_03889, partial [Reticulomyxa filosa]